MIVWIQFDADIAAPVTNRHHSNGRCAIEGIQDEITRTRPGKDAGLHQLGRHDGEVGAGIGLGGDGPNGAAITR